MENRLLPTEVISADIGGTNGRFAIVAISADAKFSVRESHTFSCADFETFGDMMDAFLNRSSLPRPAVAHIAVAGRTSRRQAHITNIGWEIFSDELEARTGLTSVTFMNDFAAVAEAIPHLGEKSYRTLKPGSADPSAPISVMGPGTGFGVAQLIPVLGHYRVIATEGGHQAFAPTTQLERDLWEHLKKSREHVCVESLLSGRGLARIHDFLVDYAGSGPKGLEPHEISQAAAEGKTPSCVRAVQLFLSVLGSVAGDIALTHGGRGGVWIGGGIIPKIYDLIDGTDLIQRFGAKGVMSPYLKDIPINVITDTEVALIGAAAGWLSDRNAQDAMGL